MRIRFEMDDVWRMLMIGLLLSQAALRREINERGQHQHQQRGTFHKSMFEYREINPGSRRNKQEQQRTVSSSK